MASASAKLYKESRDIFAVWIKMVSADEKYFFAKSMDLFYRLPVECQSVFIKFFGEKEKQQFWLDNYDDPTQYREVIRSILFFHSGRKAVGDPDKERLRNSIAEFTKSREFITLGPVAEAKSFKEGLDNL